MRSSRQTYPPSSSLHSVQPGSLVSTASNPALSQLVQRRRLAGSGHPGHENPAHVLNYGRSCVKKSPSPWTSEGELLYTTTCPSSTYSMASVPVWAATIR